jgi:hypothetical protein
MMDSPEPMVRIACQSAVLNIYKVRDGRAREHALQADLLALLFEKFGSISRSKFDAVRVSCGSYAVAVTLWQLRGGSYEATIAGCNAPAVFSPPLMSRVRVLTAPHHQPAAGAGNTCTTPQIKY